MDCNIHLFNQNVPTTSMRWIIPNDPMIADRDDAFLGKENLFFMNHYPLTRTSDSYFSSEKFSAFELLVFWYLSNFTFVLGFAAFVVGLFAFYSSRNDQAS
jgi:hypothetical protein